MLIKFSLCFFQVVISSSLLKKIFFEKSTGYSTSFFFSKTLTTSAANHKVILCPHASKFFFTRQNAISMGTDGLRTRGMAWAEPSKINSMVIFYKVWCSACAGLRPARSSAINNTWFYRLWTQDFSWARGCIIFKRMCTTQ